MIWCYEIVFGVVRVTPDQFFEFRVSSTIGATPSSCISAITPAELDHYFSLKESSVYGISSRFLSLTRTLPSFKKSLHRIDLTDLLADAWLLDCFIFHLNCVYSLFCVIIRAASAALLYLPVLHLYGEMAK